MGVPYDERVAHEALERWAPRWGEALALRTCTARWLGSDPALVLHGGGNTSVKTELRDDTGASRRALCVKGSGWDLATIEPAGHVALDLDRLLPLRALDALDDERMVNAHRTRMFDASAPNPSVETLLHAFLPHAWIDHSHAEAVLAISNLDDGWQRLAEALGPDVVRVPYTMPGFQLAKAAVEAYESNPDCIGLALHQHGLFSFGGSARESYERHLEIVARADRWLDRNAPERPPAPADLDAARARAAALAPLLRGRLSGRFLLHHRVDEVVLDALDRPDVEHLAGSGPLTPDHVLRTRCWPWLLDGSPDWGLEAWRARNRAYFDANAAGRPVKRLDEDPRVIWAPGVGIFGVGRTDVDARVAADISERTLKLKRRAAALGPFRGLPDRDLFDMEHWSLEQAKLGKVTEAPLARRVAWVTGGAGAIGVGIAAELLRAGAHVVLVDRDEGRLAEAMHALASDRVSAQTADVTSQGDVDRALGAAALRHGGVDLFVLAAGIAVSAPIEATSPFDFDRVVAVNLGGVHRCLSAAALHLRAQARGGDIVLISSKNVMGPGAQFGAYSASKAGAHQLCKVAALELAPVGVRVNLVAPDAVFAEGSVQSGLWAEIGPDRAASKGLSAHELPEHYRRRNLLKVPVTARDVGRAVVFFASGQTPTTGATLPVDGGLADAFPR
jgi:rhamnose utilization protein RhaD (predicted bifunctional aldolase and dehydrogenase)/NAD(P)-dependent dehydrogenase (short-subunit alcohol dehydrogenase family)